MEPTLNGPFREVSVKGVKISLWVIFWDPNIVIDGCREVVDLWRLSVREVFLYIYIYNIHVYKYGKTSLSRPTTEPTLNGPFRETVALGS